jgi:D-tagatose-1,6-bisphosphate aldolase subunit GatZ/KbaZ
MDSIVARLSGDDVAGQTLKGIYSICSAHPWVLGAAMKQALDDGTPLLIESTSNQVDQFGGYTGMKPADFVHFVHLIADRVGFSRDRLILGGDHLGPNAWRGLPAEEAMQRAEALIDAYVSAGFSKIHLDTSMSCGGDPARLSDSVVAERASRLCAIAEAAATREEKATKPVYVIGTEVPVPGGASEELANVEVTRWEAALDTVAVHRDAWRARGLDEAWERVVALVVQPGVEFDHTKVIDYKPELATELSNVLTQLPGMVFEAHSTDYQKPEALRQLVRDGFAILKCYMRWRTLKLRSSRRASGQNCAKLSRQSCSPNPEIGKSTITAMTTRNVCSVRTVIAIGYGTTGPTPRSRPLPKN